MDTGHGAVLARVVGRVQGVGFRAWTRATAEATGVAGWVRNEPDGAVLALFVGDPADVSRMVDALWRGPAAAAVRDVAVTPAPPGTEARGFRIESGR